MGLDRTVRVIGIAVAASGRALDIALLETDGADHMRHSEHERQPLLPGPLAAAVVAATRAFMGDRVLQPFAVDVIALAAETGDLTAATVAAGTGVETHLAIGANMRGASRAERAAFAIVAMIVADARSRRVK